MAKIVVLDDRVTNRNILTRLALSVEEGLQVQAFGSPIDALTRLQSENPPDLIITDYNMPEMNGAAFIETIRGKRGFAEVPIVVITVYEDREYCYKALEAGATDFLLSPVDHVEFRARARNLLTMRRQQRLLQERAHNLEEALAGKDGGAVSPLLGPVQDLMDRLPLAVDAVNRYGKLVLVNDFHERLFGVTRERALGRSLQEAYGEEYATRHGVLNDKVWETQQGLSAVTGERIEAGGRERELISVKTPLLDAAGTVQNVLTLSMEVTDLQGAVLPAAAPQARDRLTGLASSEVFVERLEREVIRARRHDEGLAVLIMDLDRFKAVNDAFGSAFGDVVVQQVAKRLIARLRETDAVARLKSDEFAVLQTGVKRPDDAAELARRLSEAFADPFLINGEEIHISASIGITLFPTDAREAKSLLSNADLAMYRAKASGRDAYRFFAAKMNLAARKAITLERELRQALATDQFLVYYQPQVDLALGRVVGMEALVRWNHPHRGIVRPGEFIGLAEDIGLIAPLTAWVLRTACHQHRAWKDSGHHGLQLSVNLSPVQFREPGVELLVERTLKETGLPPGMLDIELTENTVIDNETAYTSLQYLHELGVTLSIDDFGTGYSSLSYIKKLPVQRLKIDQSFVRQLEHDPNDAVIVRAIINLGQSLGLKVIAEGVETPGQMERLRALGCDEVQGHLVCPPVDALEFERRLESLSALEL